MRRSLSLPLSALKKERGSPAYVPKSAPRPAAASSSLTFSSSFFFSSFFSSFFSPAAGAGAGAGGIPGAGARAPSPRPPPRGGGRECESLGLGLWEEELHGIGGRERCPDCKGERAAIRLCKQRTDCPRRRVVQGQRKCHRPRVRERKARANLRIVNGEDIPSKHHPAFIRSAQIEAHRQRVDLEAGENMSDLPRNSFPRPHEELILLDDNLPSFDRGGNPRLLKFANDRARFEGRLALSHPNVLGRALPAACRQIGRAAC